MLETVILLAWIGAAILSPVIAKSKGRSGVAWTFAGLVFGPVGMLAVGLMEPVSIETREREYQLEREREVKRMLASKPTSKPQSTQDNAVAKKRKQDAERRRRDDEDAAVVAADDYDGDSF